MSEFEGWVQTPSQHRPFCSPQPRLCSKPRGQSGKSQTKGSVLSLTIKKHPHLLVHKFDSLRIKKLIGDSHVRRAREAMIATIGVGLGVLVLIWYETFSDQLNLADFI